MIALINSNPPASLCPASKINPPGSRLGYNSGNYCPESNVTRAQMAGLLVRTFDLP